MRVAQRRGSFDGYIAVESDNGIAAVDYTAPSTTGSVVVTARVAASDVETAILIDVEDSLKTSTSMSMSTMSSKMKCKSMSRLMMSTGTSRSMKTASSSTSTTGMMKRAKRKED